MSNEECVAKEPITCCYKDSNNEYIYGKTNRANCYSTALTGAQCDALNNDTSCRITKVATVSKGTSVENDDIENNYYTVTVTVSGGGCGGKTLTYGNGTNVDHTSPSTQTISAGTKTYTFKAWPKTCTSSKARATLSGGNYMESETVNLWRDWTPHPDSVCEVNPEYRSWMEADQNNSHHYYTDYKSCTNSAGETVMGYTNEWIRNQCGKSTPTTSHCYVDEQGGYHWTSNKQPSWRLVSGVSNKDFCNGEEKDACYIDTTGKYAWGQYAKTEGYTLVTSIDNKTTCESQAGVCYKNSDNDYKWAETAPNACVQVNNCWIKKSQEGNPPSTCTYNTQEACEEVEGYKEVAGVLDPKDCGPEEEPACYVRESDGAWKWGNYSKITGYYLLEYEDGTAVPEDMCTNEVPDVPKTGISPTQLVYIFMAVLMACGVGFIYYSSAMKKTN